MTAAIPRAWAWRLAAAAGSAAALWAIPAAGAETKFYPGDLGHAVATVVIFLLLLAILGRWAWRPLAEQLRQREKSISDSLARADRKQQEYEQLAQAYQARVERAEEEAKTLLEESRRQAAEAHEQTLLEARRQAAEFATRARQDIEQARQEALSDLRLTAAELAADVAGRIIRRELDPEDQQDLVEESLEELRGRIGRP